MKITHTSLIASLLFSSALFADENYKLKEISIVDKTNKTMQDIAYEQMNEPTVPTASSTLSTETFTQKDIEEIKPKNVYEILNNAQSVNISQMGRKHPYTISFRGSSSGVGSSAFGIILDGALLSDNSAMRILEVLPPETIQSLQIVRDSTALSLAPIQSFANPNGSTLQGFIVIKTKQLTQNGGGVKLSYETFNTKKGNAYYGGKSGDLYYMAAVNGIDTEGKDGFNMANEGGSAFLKTGLAKDDFNIELNVFYSRYFQEIQTNNSPLSGAYDVYWKYEPFENRLVSLSMAKNWSQNQITNITLSHAKASWDHDQDTTGDTDSYFVGTQKNDSIDIKHTMKLSDTILKIGGQAIWYDAPNGELYYEGRERKEQIYGAFVQAEHFISDKLVIDEAIRIDKKHTDKLYEIYAPSMEVNKKIKMGLLQLTTIDDQWSKAAVNMALGALYKLDDNNSLSAKFAYSTYSPVDGSTNSEGGSLEDEEQFKYEIGFENVLGSLTSKMNIFYYDIRNLKFAEYGVSLDDPVTFYQEDQKRWGTEISFDGRIDNFSYLLNYAFVKTNYKDEEIPNHLVSAKLGYTYENITSNVLVKYVSNYESNFLVKDGSYHEVGDFTTLDASIDYHHKLYSHDATVSVYGKNITDQEYSTKVGWENVGSIFGVSYAINF
ncbi:TonB-dependent receptor plug domain-containing protein [Halarcobacter anaerophilus]|uniref:TonB-dependent receptor plug domain-containing protein n=1 Tax=Halarcobacter anaerophilus TaxID=877500 RepID=UPI0005CA062F|nr:TonB-dependent receptor plug domain-containing protein [Halarcobacter anaerophilus]